MRCTRRHGSGRAIAVALSVVVGFGCSGGRRQAEDRPARRAGEPPRCSGTLSGPVQGDFTCTVVANYWERGTTLTGGRRAAVVSILSNPYDPTHNRPAGLKDLSFNLEIPGEPRAGSWTKAQIGRGTVFAVALDDGRLFERVQDLTLTLESAAGHRVDAATGGRLYHVSGSVKATLADEAGTQARLTASF